MSVKNNSLLLAALAALGLTLTSGREAIAETLLDNIEVSAIKFAQVTESGGVVGIVSVATGSGGAVEIRAIANAQGDVKLFSNLSAVASLVKRCKLAEDTMMDYLRMADTGTATNPLARLKSQHKSAKADLASSTAKVVELDALISAAVSAGDDLATGTPNYYQWQDYGKRKTTVNEVKTWATAKVSELADALTAAGISPVTYLPL